MKKIILFLLLLINVGYSQIDTANYNFNLDLLTGKYTSLISKSTIFGAQGFKYVVQELQSTSIDTTLFQYVGNIDGKYTTVQNISTYYGKDSGTVQMQLVNGSTGSSIDTSTIPFLNQNNTFTGNINIFTGKVVVGTLAITTTGDVTTFGNIFAGSNSKAIGWQSRGFFQAMGDGTVIYTNNAGTSFTTFQLGAGNFTAGFIRGTVDTDITSVFVRTPNGTLRYILVADDGTISTSTTAP